MRHWLRNKLPDHQAVLANRWLRPFSNTLLHPALWHLNRRSAAGAVAAGLFCGLIPGPLQMPSAALCALIFRINLPLALFTTLYTNPLTIVPLYMLAYQIGRLVTGEGAGFTTPPEFDWHSIVDWERMMLDWMLGLGKPLAVGLPLLAAILALAGYFIVKGAWRLYLIRAWRKRQKSRSGAKKPSK